MKRASCRSACLSNQSRIAALAHSLLILLRHPVFDGRAFSAPSFPPGAEVDERGGDMKKIVPLLAAAALGLGLSGAVQAHVFIGVGVGVPAVPAWQVYGPPVAYYPPPPVLYAPPPRPVIYAPAPPVVAGYYPRRYYYPVY
jgi:hypothetical protein